MFVSNCPSRRESLCKSQRRIPCRGGLHGRRAQNPPSSLTLERVRSRRSDPPFYFISAQLSSPLPLFQFSSSPVLLLSSSSSPSSSPLLRRIRPDKAGPDLEESI